MDIAKGNRFTDEFKQDAVAQVAERGYAVSDVAERPTDITYIKKHEGWSYLAVVIDLFWFCCKVYDSFPQRLILP